MKLFNAIQLRKPSKNKFDLSHEKKLTLDMGKLVPIMVQEILPGDNFRVNSEIMIRLAPMIAPIMHRINVFTHYFFVPNRIIWDEWEDFITGGRDGNLVPAHPFFQGPGSQQSYFGVGSLWDYMGLPTIDPVTPPTVSYNFNALPFRAYNTIYNEYYRDPNLTNEVPVSKTSGQDNTAHADAFTLRTRAWERDYFTSALPWAQRGPAVYLPTNVQYKNPATVIDSLGQPTLGLTDMGTDAGELVVDQLAGDKGTIENIENIGITINDLRASNRLQEWLEKNARGGWRYVEQLLSHFGVHADDARLQRPEYLGGGKQNIITSEVLSNFQFSGDPSGLPQGNMSGHGISVGNTNGFKRSFKEHGYVIGIMSILPNTNYSQGIPKHFLRDSKLDYAFPEFAQLGEQPIANEELFVNYLNTNPSAPFGYQSRYAEYKYGISTVHGNFRDSLEYWHMGRKFAALPTLAENFVMSDPTKRIFAVEDPGVNSLYCNIYNNVSAIRPLPYFGTPTL